MMKLLMVAVMALMPMGVLAQDFDKGLAAAQAGDYATALQEWRPLAEQGDADAQGNLGQMYDRGNGVPQDYAEAVKWYRLAAEQGVARAQARLGSKYRDGEGVPQNFDEAHTWYERAMAQNNIPATINLGDMYSRGDGVGEDLTLAMQLYAFAEKLGGTALESRLGLTSSLLGITHAAGIDVPQDFETAHMWFNIAAANGREDMRARRDEVLDFMTREQLADAQRRARVCMASDYQDCE